MKTRIEHHRSAAFMAAALALAGCASPPHEQGLDRILSDEGRAGGSLYGYRCTVGAHRGSSSDYRENTLVALKAAEIDDKYAFIEFDVQYAGDETIVVYHDKSLFRLFGKLSAVRKHSFEELSEKTEGQIARYRDAMDILTKPLNIEIKASGDAVKDYRLVDELVADLRQRKRESDVMLSSISSKVIRYIHSRYPGLPTGKVLWLTGSTYLHWDRLTKGVYDELRDCGADYLIIHVANLRNLEDLLKLKPRGTTIIFWDFDDSAYLVHADLSDRLWNQSTAGNFLQALRRRISFPGTQDEKQPPPEE